MTRGGDGKVNSVRYDAVNAMLLNEFLKEHKKVEELNETVTKQDAAVAQQSKDFKAMVEKQRDSFIQNGGTGNANRGASIRTSESKRAS